ncbi:MAG: hypothetical protein U0795_27120 [Pirellulales bacterium]
MRGAKVLLILCVAAFVLLCLFSRKTDRGGVGERISLGPYLKGEVTEVVAQFRVYNREQRKMTVDSITGSCACTDIVIDSKVIPPWTSALLTLRANPDSFLGRERTVAAHLVDDRQRLATYEMTCQVVPKLAVEPDVSNMGDVRRSDPVVKRDIYVIAYYREAATGEAPDVSVASADRRLAIKTASKAKVSRVGDLMRAVVQLEATAFPEKEMVSTTENARFTVTARIGDQLETIESRVRWRYLCDLELQPKRVLLRGAQAAALTISDGRSREFAITLQQNDSRLKVVVPPAGQWSSRHNIEIQRSVATESLSKLERSDLIVSVEYRDGDTCTLAVPVVMD